jgi:hypothetical protein
MRGLGLAREFNFRIYETRAHELAELWSPSEAPTPSIIG